jgi:hypothetical protein
MGNFCAGDVARLTFFRGVAAAASDFIAFVAFRLERVSPSRLAILVSGRARHA